MRINDTLAVSANGGPDGINDAKRSAGNRPVGQTGQHAPSVSTGSPDLKRLQDGVNQAPEIRQDKVERLQRAVQDGSYQVKDTEIAQSMLNDILGR
jgi:flagellar biosynthesis anti-sigma factor FlgM